MSTEEERVELTSGRESEINAHLSGELVSLLERWHRDFLATDLNKASKLVGVRLWDYASGRGSGAHPGRCALSEELGMSLSTVDRALRECRDSGWLKRTSESNSQPFREGSFDVYALAFPGSTAELWSGDGAA